MDMLFLPYVYITAGLLLGLIIGIGLHRRASHPPHPHQPAAEVEPELDPEALCDSYQEQIVASLDHTARLLHQLGGDPDHIQQHVLNNADRLRLDSKNQQELLQGLDEWMTPASPEAPPTEAVEPPRDYAPHRSGEPGTLDEHFRLPRVAG